MSTDIADDQVAELVDEIAIYVRGGESIERAVARLRRRGNIPDELIDAGRRGYERQVGLIRELRNPLALVEAEYRTGGWYTGPRPDDRFWWPLRDRLSDGLDDGAVGAIDRASSRIVSLLRPPGADEIRSRGLVLGYVQSGKTTSFMSVVGKAADVGYRMVIVLSGITDSLRAQTQQRLDEVLVGDDAGWHWLTYHDADFNEPPRNASGLLRDPHKRLLAVVKKNPARLRRLVRFIDAAGDSVLKECPILVIDDEADQASIDIGRNGRQSRINALIGQILRKPKAAYIAYTATPFANLLVRPADFEGLYPRDFIVSLDRPVGYFGPEKIFGREPLAADEPGADIDDGLDIVRHVPPADITAVQPPPARGAAGGWSPSMPDSLAAALRWFVLATAARRVRDGFATHSTMLIHTTMLTAGHDALAAEVEDHLTALRQEVMVGDRATLRALRDDWEAETARMPAESLGETPVDWTDICLHLRDVVAGVRTVIDNSQSGQRLAYEPDDPSPVIAIGGNTLSRGLTLSGLVCSYFVRATNAYDTLLQMGRWFGYRPGYGDLVRIWMTEDLESWFYDLATVEEEIRQEIRRYEIEGCRPDELAVRIRTHPAMIVTAAAKMRSAVEAEVSFGNSRQQTILFHHRDQDWLRPNLQATRKLLDAAVRTGLSPVAMQDGRYVVRSVPVDLILQFLHDYRFHEDSHRLRPDLLERYISSENALGALRSWSVVIVGDRSGERNGARDPLSLGGGIAANRINRSRLDMPTIGHANIKALVSRIDRVADLNMAKAEAVAAAGGDDDGKLRALREDLLGAVGLLCLYPIAADSVPLRPDRAPKPGAKRRVPLDAADDVIGVGLFFPARRAASGVRYLSADLSALVPEQPDESLVEALDNADEVLASAQEASQRRPPAARR
ncbi:Z1 domain-containing protein [Micromonospora sp. NPDC048170]|uniref:Z1 domain-containing protein n=1 Tax=Micromonospora sp. NPDC048170 TaxID=3154819 RepID=UPI003402C440